MGVAALPRGAGMLVLHLGPLDSSSLPKRPLLPLRLLHGLNLHRKHHDVSRLLLEPRQLCTTRFLLFPLALRMY